MFRARQIAAHLCIMAIRVFAAFCLCRFLAARLLTRAVGLWRQIAWNMRERAFWQTISERLVVAARRGVEARVQVQTRIARGATEGHFLAWKVAAEWVFVGEVGVWTRHAMGYGVLVLLLLVRLVVVLVSRRIASERVHVEVGGGMVSHG